MERAAHKQLNGGLNSNSINGFTQMLRGRHDILLFPDHLPALLA